jgi:lysozyme
VVDGDGNDASENGARGATTGRKGREMILKLGDSGTVVAALQKQLLAVGFDPDGQDGVFGHWTDLAVRQFQAAHGLVVDGEVSWPTGETADALNAGQTGRPAPSDVPDDAVALATVFEGFSAAPYQDSAGVWTIGYGSTRDASGSPVTRDTPDVTRDQANVMMRRDLEIAVTTISADVKVALTTDERAALEDFIYNVGVGNFAGSTLLRDLNAGRYDLAAAQFGAWDHAGGQVLSGLLRRREAERQEFLKGQAS